MNCRDVRILAIIPLIHGRHTRNKMRIQKKIILVVLTALYVAGCGSGSSGGGASPAAFSCAVAGEGAYSISGNVRSAAFSMLDSDTLANGQPVVDNGSFASAQLIPNPVSLGGFAARDVQDLLDTNDFYAIELAAGDQVTLWVGDSGPADDLDLFLYDSAQALVDLSTNFYDPGSSAVDRDVAAGIKESVVAPADGLYYVEVRVWEGASGYTLIVGSGPEVLSAVTSSLKEEFVPGEVLVKYYDTGNGQVPLTASASAATKVEHMAGSAGQVMRMRMLPTVTASAVAASARQMRFRNEAERRKYETLQLVKELQLDPAVEYAAPNYIWQTLRTPDDPLYTQQWHYQDSSAVAGGINLPSAWDITTGSPDVVVAVIDTGVRSDHPDLKNKLVNGYDFVSDASVSGDGDGIDDDPFDPSGGFFHGTHVAGTVAADSNNGVGVAGVAWNARIMPLRALGETEGTFFDIMQAMRYAAGLENTSGVILPPEDRADIINLSLGGLLSAPDRLQQSVVDEVRAQGIIVVASAGNRASSAELYPASYEGVVSVSATGREAQIAEYSSFGPNVDVAAPGGAVDFRVVSTWGGEEYALLRGTSMASPHVAGVIALMQSVRIADGKDKLTPEQLDFLLASGDLTRDLGAEGRDDLYGYGLIDAARAVAAARLDPEPTPILSITPGEIEFGETVSAAALNIRNLGSGSLAVSVSLSLGDSWLNIEADDSVAADGLGVYTLRVDRTGLAPGSYAAEVRVTPTEFGAADIQEVVIPVSMTVGSNSLDGDVGEILMFLVDTARPNEIRADLPLPVVDTLSGAYEFKDVPAACYFVYASTDIDADLVLAELGEAWNIWFGTATEAASAGVLELDGDKQDIDIIVSFE